MKLIIFCLVTLFISFNKCLDPCYDNPLLPVCLNFFYLSPTFHLMIFLSNLFSRIVLTSQWTQWQQKWMFLWHAWWTVNMYMEGCSIADICTGSFRIINSFLFSFFFMMLQWKFFPLFFYLLWLIIIAGNNTEQSVKDSKYCQPFSELKSICNSMMGMSACWGYAYELSS